MTNCCDRNKTKKASCLKCHAHVPNPSLNITNCLLAYPIRPVLFPKMYCCAQDKGKKYTKKYREEKVKTSTHTNILIG